MKNSTFGRDFYLLLGISFFYMASPMLVTPLITGFSESLGASSLIMGLVGGLTNLASLVFSPFTGNLADRISKARLSSIGVLCLALACTGYILAVNPAMILFFRIVNGIGFACCAVCFSTWIANLLPRNRIGFGMGMYGMMNALAMAIAPAVGVELYHLFGYRMAFMAADLFALLSLLLIQLTSDKGLPPAKTPMQKSFHFGVKRVIPIALVIMCFTIPYCTAQSFLVRYTEMRELPVAVSLFFTLYAAALLVIRSFFRNLFDRIAFKIFLFGSSVSAFLSLLFLYFMKNNGEMALGAFFMAGGFGIMCTVCQSAAVLLVGPENRGLANSTYYLGLNSGMAFAPMIGGFLYGHLPIAWFFPALMPLIPLGLLLYFLSEKLCARS